MKPKKGGRLDAVLVELEIAGGRERAKEWIAAGKVFVNGQQITKPSFPVTPEDELDCTDCLQKYASRGGYKLEKALAYLRETGLTPHEPEIMLCGMTIIDIGASTGGFTDCLLQHGAEKVYAVDVGHGQLHPKLREDPRVVNLEGQDIRSPELLDKIPEKVPLAVMDLSFISLTKVLPSVLPFLLPMALVICLIKPQFEVGRGRIGKKGIVKDSSARRDAVNKVVLYMEQQHFERIAVFPSPITGGDGNEEYLLLSRYCI
ncbi:MAG: TlyA family RNA methyltransferase [Oscillospiraceae bacterium]|nr:TlyA family RNA methyltransferase [Oscillospiraceae bacterium]